MGFVFVRLGFVFTELGLVRTSESHLDQPPVPRQGHLELEPGYTGILHGFLGLQTGRLDNLPGQTVPVFCHPPCKEVPHG